MANSNVARRWGLANAAIALTFIVFLILLSISAVITGRNAAAASESLHRVIHTNEVLVAIDRVHSAVAEVESSARGYLLTGDRNYRTNLALAASRSQTEIETLSALAASEGQAAALADIRFRLSQRLARANRLAAMRDAPDFNLEGIGPHLEPGRIMSERLMRDLERFRTSEQNLLEQRRRNARENVRRASISFWSSTILGFVFLIGLFLVMDRVLRIQRRQRAVEAEHAARLEREVARRTAEYKSLNRELELFSYSVSHDLRGPLRALGGYATSLREDLASKLSPDENETISRIELNVKKMGNLIDDLMRLAKVTRSELVLEQVDLSSIVEQSVSEARNRTNLTVDANIEPNVVAEGDRRMLSILIDNLVDNAVKFSSKSNQIRIEFARTSEDGSVGYIVRDHGAGFESANAKNLYEPFQRYHTDREFEGTGIGLAICRRIVERHGGRIWAESEPGKGATFHFTLDASSTGRRLEAEPTQAATE